MKRKEGKINVKTVIAGIMGYKKKKDIAVEAGSLARSDSARINTVNNTMKTNEYKKEIKPYIKALKKERNRAMLALENMLPSSIDYDKLVKALESMTKQIQLLSGEATEISKIDIKDVKEFLNKA